jgi:hypothetical protein
MERPFTKWMQRLPPYARPLGAFVYAVFFVGVVWLGSTIMIIILMALVVLAGLI